jgi:MFS family permease
VADNPPAGLSASTPSPSSGIPRNIWAVSLTSFFTDISSEMILNLLTLFLANVLGAGTAVIGLIDGVADTTASLSRILSGWISDRIARRKGLTACGYTLSAVAKPLLLLANTWPVVLLLRFADRLGKGVRTAPRDALVADSTPAERRGLAFGVNRAADTAGAMVGVLTAAAVVCLQGPSARVLSRTTFHWVVGLSIVPAFLGVLSFLLIAREPSRTSARGANKTGQMQGQVAVPAPPSRFRFSPQFLGFLALVALFTLGNSSDAFLVLRAQQLGLSVLQILLALATFNLIYALASTPAGALADRIGPARLVLAGWLVYGAVYLGLALSQAGWQVWALWGVYGLYYGLFDGTSRALVPELVSPQARGTAYGVFNAAVGVMALPASLIAGLLWQGAGSWRGFGAPAPFWFGSLLAFASALLLIVVFPRLRATR